MWCGVLMVRFLVCCFEGIYFIYFLFLNYLLSQKFKIFLRNNLHLCWSFLLSISGVAYSKHIVQIYSYHCGNDLRNHLEVCLYIYMDALTHKCVFIYIHSYIHTCVCVCSYLVFSDYWNIILTGPFSPLLLIIVYLPWFSFFSDWCSCR